MSKIYDQLQSMVGRESSPRFGLDAVNKPMIRHWCEAMQDGNPLYTDDEYAAGTEFGGVIAPPQMVMSYTMPPLWPKPDTAPDPFAQAIGVLQQAGYFGIIATTTTYEFFKPLKIGDHISIRTQLADVSEEKTTRLGTGHFVTARQTFENDQGETVCVQIFTVLVFKPAAKAAE